MKSARRSCFAAHKIDNMLSLVRRLKNVFVDRMRTWFRTIPANHKMVHDFTDTGQLSNGSTNIDIVAIYADDALQTHTVGYPTYDQGGNVEPIFGKKRSSHI